jgi:GNAT superfamily N-acetyltransferase
MEERPVITVEQLVIPETVDAPDAADYLAAVAIRNEIEIGLYGTRDRFLSAADILPFYQDAHAPTRLFGVRVGTQLVGFSTLETKTDDPDHLWIGMYVLPEHCRQGVGTALLQHAEQLARDEGRRKLLLYASSAVAPGEQITAPTGFGALPADNPEVRFLLKHGYSLEQVERGSRLALPVDVQVPEAPSGYRLHFWQNRTPEQWLDDMAVLYTRMNDAPSAGLDEPEDVYTADRVRDFDANQAKSPRIRAVVAVEHVPSGRLAGYTEARVPPDPSRAISQGNTLVLREHRGHRLGMLLKLANLERVQREFAGHPAITTFNAEENRYMLDVNEKVGFTPMGYEGGWRKDL